MLSLFSNNILLIAIAVIVLLAVLLFISYVKAPPSNAYIISGLSKEPRVLIGSGGFRIPFFERLDQVYLGQITVDIKTDVSVPTNDFINVDVDAVAKIRVLPTNEGTRLAAKNFLNMRPDQIAEQLQDSLQGNMREIVGTLDLRKLNTDRDGFSDAVMNKAQPDMSKLGIEIISCNIQNVTDKEGLIKDLGADNTAKIKKDAAINRAVAERDIKIAQAKAKKYAMLQEAEGIRAKGEAEALAMDKKAEAYKKYNNAAIAQMVIGVLPEIVKNAADPISAIKEVKIFSGGGSGENGGIASISGNVPVVIKQAFDVVKEATGVDMSDVVKAGTIEAKTTRNINIGGKAGEAVEGIIGEVTQE